ncbi:hypothetical protein CWB98_07180 [Pseudoalteromonas rubra]|uniref:Uncharacterized protein n=2 Tax=Pseudoalteromonas rubra TaxID=43658 RepID=A0A5S3X1X8_9GAMM|nr:hypothetical protein CWB98_07180 [Pseudoalteromonas rubra]
MIKAVSTLFTLLMGLYASMTLASDNIFYFKSQGKEIQASYSGSYLNPRAVTFHLDCSGTCNLQRYSDQVLADFVRAVQNQRNYRYKLVRDCGFRCDHEQGGGGQDTAEAMSSYSDEYAGDEYTRAEYTGEITPQGWTRTKQFFRDLGTATIASTAANHVLDIVASLKKPGGTRFQVIPKKHTGAPAGLFEMTDQGLVAVDEVKVTENGNHLIITHPMTNELGHETTRLDHIKRALKDYLYEQRYIECTYTYVEESPKRMMFVYTCFVNVA